MVGGVLQAGETSGSKDLSWEQTDKVKSSKRIQRGQVLMVQVKLEKEARAVAGRGSRMCSALWSFLQAK